MNEVVDGQYQKYSVESGAYIRNHFFGKSPALLRMVDHLSDERLQRLRRGGHDPKKVYAAYKKAVEHTGSPTVILAKTIKGYGLGEAGEGRNITHQQKKLNDDELREFRSRFGIPIADEEIHQTPFYRPADDSPEMVYLKERRQELGGPVPSRITLAPPLQIPPLSAFGEFLKGSGDREASTTMAFVRMLGWLLRNKELGKLIVPIIPDEARTFGMEALFRQCGIYAHTANSTSRSMPRRCSTTAKPRTADPRGRHQRGGVDFLVCRCRYRVRQSWHQHDSFLHLLLDVRLSAGR